MTSETLTQIHQASLQPQNVPVVTPAELYQRMNQPGDWLLLDVRNDEDFNAWKVEGLHTPETIHFFYADFLEDEESILPRIPRDREIVAVCAKGGASELVAGMLRERGIQAINLERGMLGWGNYLNFQPVVETTEYQIYQISRVARGCISYVLISQGQAAMIDPLRFHQEYLDFLNAKEASPRLLLDTHAHADHISGAPALSKATGAPYYLHPYDAIHPFDLLPARLDYHMLNPGQQFTLGDLVIQAIHVPGHTLGQVNYLVTATNGSAYLFSGDNLFIQSFGRPDLGGRGEAWAPIVYDTIFSTIKACVPEDALVLPGHFARFEEMNADGIFAQPLSTLWHTNRDLQHTSREQFIEYVLTHLPTMPEQYIQIKRINAGLVIPDEDEASELELGKNICALSTMYLSE